MSVDPDVLKLQNELADKLGARVTIQHSAKGDGKLIIKYNRPGRFYRSKHHLLWGTTPTPRPTAITYRYVRAIFYYEL